MANNYGFYKGVAGGMRDVTGILMARAEADRKRKETLDDRQWEEDMWDRRMKVQTDEGLRKAKGLDDIESESWSGGINRPLTQDEGWQEGKRRRENEDRQRNMRLQARLTPRAETGDGRDRQREMLWDQYQQLTNEGSWQSDIIGERKKGDFNINNLDPAKQKRYRELMNYFGMSADVAGPPAPSPTSPKPKTPKDATVEQLKAAITMAENDKSLTESQRAARLKVLNDELASRN